MQEIKSTSVQEDLSWGYDEHAWIYANTHIGIRVQTCNVICGKRLAIVLCQAQVPTANKEGQAPSSLQLQMYIFVKKGNAIYLAIKENALMFTRQGGENRQDT